MAVLGSIDYTGSGTVNRFRRQRAALLRRQVRALAARLGRSVAVLDVGGRPDYWTNVGFDDIAHVHLLNARRAELDRPLPDDLPAERFTRSVGDARDLTDFADGSVDLVHSNSVIEHVGGWTDMERMAAEARRVGLGGWVQTPAWSFPFEPHFHLPAMHWFGAPMRARMLALSPRRAFRRQDLAGRRRIAEGINLLTRREVEVLFPNATIYVERYLLLAKSYVAHWMPEPEAGGSAVARAA